MIDQFFALLATVCVKIPAALSMLFSSYIAYSIVKDPQKRSIPKERIILGLSCSDILFSFFFFLSTWPMPRGTEYAYGSVGNMQTCNMQGFFMQLGIMTPMYNGFLAVYCYIYVCKNWSRQQMKYVEIFGHIFVFVFALSTAIAGLVLELYNDAWVVCWIDEFPEGCTQSYQITDGTTSSNCIRGDNAYIYRMAFFFGMLWVDFFLTFFSFLFIYLHFRAQETKMAAYILEYAVQNNGNNETHHVHSDSRKVAVRGALFSGAFLLTWGPATIDHLMYFIGKEASLYFYFFVFALMPSQGVFNFLAFIAPSIRRYWKEKRQNQTKANSNNTELVTSWEGGGSDEDQNNANKQHESYNGEEKEELIDDITPAS